MMNLLSLPTAIVTSMISPLLGANDAISLHCRLSKRCSHAFGPVTLSCDQPITMKKDDIHVLHGINIRRSKLCLEVTRTHYTSFYPLVVNYPRCIHKLDIRVEVCGDLLRFLMSQHAFQLTNLKSLTVYSNMYDLQNIINRLHVNELYLTDAITYTRNTQLPVLNVFDYVTLSTPTHGISSLTLSPKAGLGVLKRLYLRNVRTLHCYNHQIIVLKSYADLKPLSTKTSEYFSLFH
jgi:hypothetical protein